MSATEKETRISRISPRLYETEMELFAHGYRDEETAEIQGITTTAAKSRKSRSKAYLGGETLYEALAIALRDNHLAVELDKEPSYKPLSYMEGAFLRLTALGWPVRKISERYGITENTVDTYRQKVRQKVGARNTAHSLLRAFQLGIFNVGEAILDPDEQESLTNGNLMVGIDDRILKLGELGIRYSREIELVELFKGLDQGWFNRQVIYGLDFYADAKSDNARSHAYGRVVLSIKNKLEAGFGEPIIEKGGMKGPYRVYRFTKPITIGDPDNLKVIPEMSFEDILPILESRPRRKNIKEPGKTPSAKRPKIPSPILPRPSPIRSEAPASEREIQLPNVLMAEELAELDERFFASIGLRDRDEVLDNPSIKKAAAALASSGELLEYSERVVLALRYGAPISKNYNLLLNRAGKKIKLSSLVEKLPFFRGLDVYSTAQITAMSPYKILQTERGILLKHMKDVNESEALLERIDDQIRELRAKYISDSLLAGAVVVG